MKQRYELNEREAEWYDIEYPERIKTKKRLLQYVAAELAALHPGFSETYIWDYRIYRTENVQKIRAVVMDRTVYTEYRLRRPHTVYTTPEDGACGNYFCAARFTETGTRRTGYVPAALLGAAVLCAVAVPCFILSAKPEAAATAAYPVPDSPPDAAIEVPSVFMLCNEYGGAVLRAGGRAETVRYTRYPFPQLQLRVSGCTPAELYARFGECVYFSAAEFSEITYAAAKPEFSAEVRLSFQPSDFEYRTDTDASARYALLDEIHAQLEKHRVKIVHELVVSEENKLRVTAQCPYATLNALAEIEPYVSDKKLLITELELTKIRGTDTVSLNFECMPALDTVTDFTPYETVLSTIFPADEPPSGNGKPEKITPKAQNEVPDNAAKIGTVRNGKDVTVYYRTEDGKIIRLRE
ncbi:hypothetical protein [Treponema brennaborense]|uniref:Uncharacterized protein n=1 Tax=Treponema brennaborense (strain DSM 12168 / CIP 105900 / DD5/3) TaxID=906968 RepID=F4LMK1_TREBD|nr:hypothetical protein [Treponema brennaborense]AEE16748.1 hypothetical protein Trebr_1321 [Treponema brennaborense DSM 12168]